MGVLKQPCAVLRGPGKRAFHVAEQFAFKQRFHDRRAVADRQTPRRHGAKFVQCVRHEFLPGARGAADQRNPVMRRDPLDAGESFQHLRAAAHHAVKTEVLEQAGIQFAGLAPQAGFGQHFAHPAYERGGR